MKNKLKKAVENMKGVLELVNVTSKIVFIFVKMIEFIEKFI